MRKPSMKTVVVLCAILVAIVLTASTAAYAATPGGWSVSKAGYSFLSRSQKNTFLKLKKN